MDYKLGTLQVMLLLCVCPELAASHWLPGSSALKWGRLYLIELSLGMSELLGKTLKLIWPCKRP